LRILEFSFSEDFVAAKIANILEAIFDQLACFLFGVSNDGCEVFIFEAYELSVQHGYFYCLFLGIRCGFCCLRERE
jgi:hypothetical protein